MHAEFLGTFCDAVLNELHEMNVLAFSLRLALSILSCPQQTGSEVAEPVCLLIDQEDKSFFGTAQPIHFNQAGTTAFDCRQRCLESMRKAIEYGRANCSLCRAASALLSAEKERALSMATAVSEAIALIEAASRE